MKPQNKLKVVLKLAGILQVAEGVYSCVVLALTLLTAFCPQVESQEANGGLKLGWPQPAHLRLLQRQGHALSHSHLPNSGRGKALARNLKGCLVLTAQLLSRMHVSTGDRHIKEIATSQHQLQMFLDNS